MSIFKHSCSWAGGWGAKGQTSCFMSRSTARVILPFCDRHIHTVVTAHNKMPNLLQVTTGPLWKGDSCIITVHPVLDKLY